ncbi:MAG TPA: PilT/PilU family type 4a pilus ATPase [Acidimicrobiales bacterium]|nr:PilT/PilU family type 4a pilus ATPase [Acidimicrobiales bacterium]
MNFEEILRHLVSVEGTDVHLKVGSLPRVRVGGVLEPAPFPEPTTESMDALAAQLLDAAALAALRADGSFDLVRSVAGLGRFRVNLYQQRGSVACAVRRVVPGIPTLEELELPASVAKLAEAQRGLVVLAGPSGSGTTTTAAAVVDAINRSRSVHIATIENPIEVLHADKEGIVSQREIGTDAPSMAEAVEHCLKQDPDVIFIGELPDADTVRAALAAAETGKLVIVVMRSTSSIETVDRLIQAFPLAEQRQARVTLSRNLFGIVSQRLLDRADGAGRVAAAEVFIGTAKSLACISDPERIDELPRVLEEGRYSGMQTFDQGVLDLYRDGLITIDEAMGVVLDEEEFRINIERGGYGI